MTKKLLTPLLILAICLGVTSSYVNAISAMPFKPFNLNYYRADKTLSDEELVKEITAYANYTINEIYHCLEEESTKSDSVKNNPNYTNHCTNLHAADYLRLNYLYYLNAKHTLDSNEVLRFVGSENNEIYGGSGSITIDNRPSANFVENFANINFVTDEKGNPVTEIQGMLGGDYSISFKLVMSSIRSCSLESGQYADEESRKVYLNGDLAIDTCKEGIYAKTKEADLLKSSDGKPMSEDQKKACENIEQRLISTSFDLDPIKVDGVPSLGHYKETGPCAKYCQPILKEACTPDTTLCSRTSSCNCKKTSPPRGLDPLYYKEVQNPDYNEANCRSCVTTMMSKENSACVRTAAEEKKLKERLDGCEKAKELPKVTCHTTTNILKSTTGFNTTEKIVTSVKEAAASSTLHAPKWLPLTDQEKELMEYGSDFKDQNDTTVDLKPNPESICAQRGFGALICVVVRFLGTVSDGVFNLLEGMMIIPAKVITTGKTVADAPNYSIWNSFRNIANISLIIITMILILAQITSYRLETYNLRRTIPLLISAAILINLSYYICQIAVDLSNIIGNSIKQGLDQLTIKVTSTTDLGISKLTSDILMYGLVGVGTFVTVAIAMAVGLSVVVPIIFGVLISAIMVVMILTFRQLVVILSIILSPLAFAMIALPGAQTIFKRWVKIFISSLAVYPIIAVLFGSGKLAYGIISASSAGGFLMSTFSILMIVLPLFLLPTILSQAMKSMPLIGNRVQNLISGTSQRSTDRLMKTNFMQSIKQAEDRKKYLDSVGKSRPSKWNIGRNLRSGFNQKVTNKLPIYRDIRSAGSGIDEARWEQVETLSGNFDKSDSNQYLTDISQGNFRGRFDQDKLMAAILMSSSQGDSSHEIIVKALDQARSHHGLEESYVDRAMLRAMENYRGEGMIEEYAMFKQHRDVAVGQNYGFSVGLDGFNAKLDDNAKRKAIRTEFIRNAGSKIPKFSGYQKIDPSSTTQRLAKEVIEGYTDSSGKIHNGLFSNETWRKDMLKNSAGKGLDYMKHLQSTLPPST